MRISDAVLQKGERMIFALRELYTGYGYTPYRMSKFEEYDLYARNKDFLVSDNVITFTDTGGKLMALKPDVTLSIIKNSKDMPHTTQKVFYNENVYRVAKSTGSFREIMQTGLECFGEVTDKEIYEVIVLAAKSLLTVAEDCVLDISNLSLLECIIDDMDIPHRTRSMLYKAISERNAHEISDICTRAGADAGDIDRLLALVGIHGTIAEASVQLEAFSDLAGYDRFTDILNALVESDAAEYIRVDFSVVDDINYYNGIVFKGFVEGVPDAVLSGGQYDNLMRRLRRSSGAIGFAVYLDELERIDQTGDAGDDEREAEREFINVALPKGRLGERIYAMFARAGYECPAMLEPNRKLIFENTEKGVRYFWVKPSDVAIYVERGAADIGVAGKDILLEYEPDVYELLDLDTGKCRMAVAAPRGFEDDPSRTLRVATKFAGIAKKFYQSQGRDIDIIHLNGSIEIAPLLGLSDVIVDIVETGATLKENNLEVIESIVPISARLIANKAAYRFKGEQIEDITGGLSAILEEDK